MALRHSKLWVTGSRARGRVVMVVVVVVAAVTVVDTSRFTAVKYMQPWR